jgi:hypothetical protein
MAFHRWFSVVVLLELFLRPPYLALAELQRGPIRHNGAKKKVAVETLIMCQTDNQKYGVYLLSQLSIS